MICQSMSPWRLLANLLVGLCAVNSTFSGELKQRYEDLWRPAAGPYAALKDDEMLALKLLNSRTIRCFEV